MHYNFYARVNSFVYTLRPEFYREVDDGDFESPYCDAIINL